MSEFDSYLMVDWSASSKPAKGADSIWYCLVTRRNGVLSVVALENPPTRCQACSELTKILRTSTQHGQRILAGFDFPFGYPAGFATALGLEDAPFWLAIWREITGKILDHADNSNNRFAVAANLNRRISGATYPFWGCPSNCECSNLSCRKGRAGQLSEKRITDIGNMQPIWKLFGNGSVGSQALLGIPVLAALRNDPVLAPVSQVWPFETGLRIPSDWSSSKRLIVYAEIYPSLFPVQPVPGEVRDAAQVRTLATYFAALDDSGHLSDMFAGVDSLTATTRESVEREEGWTLGVGVSRRVEPGPVRGAVTTTLPPVRQATLQAQPSRQRGGQTTKPGYENRNGQLTIRCTGLAGTDHGQYVYVLKCGACGYQYGANGSDIHIRRCPACQGGRPGIPY